MKKDYMKRCFQAIDKMEAAVDDGTNEHEDLRKAVAELRATFVEARSLWWKDNVRTFNAVYRLLQSFYRQAWSRTFNDTERLRRALRFFTNQILDQFVLGGDEGKRDEDTS